MTARDALPTPAVEPASLTSRSARPPDETAARPEAGQEPVSNRYRRRHGRRSSHLAASAAGGAGSQQPRQAVISTDDRSTVPAPFSIPLPFEEHPIDLATALRLADVANPTIGAARTLILEALANQLAGASAAGALAQLRASATTGIRACSSGLPARSSRSRSNRSTWAPVPGLVTAGTAELPGVNILTPLTDAWFEPLAATPASHRRLDSTLRRPRTKSCSTSRRSTSQLLGNQSILEAQRLSESQVHDVVEITRHYRRDRPGPRFRRQPGVFPVEAPARRRAQGRGRAGGRGGPAGQPAQPRPVGAARGRRRPAGSSSSSSIWTRLSASCCRSPCDSGPTSRPEPPRSARPRPTSNRKSAGRSCPPSGWASAAAPSAAAATSFPRSSATSPAGPTSTCASTGPCSTWAPATSR